MLGALWTACHLCGVEHGHSLFTDDKTEMTGKLGNHLHKQVAELGCKRGRWIPKSASFPTVSCLGPESADSGPQGRPPGVAK